MIEILGQDFLIIVNYHIGQVCHTLLELLQSTRWARLQFVLFDDLAGPNPCNWLLIRLWKLPSYSLFCRFKVSSSSVHVWKFYMHLRNSVLVGCILIACFGIDFQKFEDKCFLLIRQVWNHHIVIMCSF